MPAARRLSIAIACLVATPLALAVGDPWLQLESPDYAEREAAVAALWSQGKAVRERLAVEAESGGLDKRERCRRLIRLIDLGVPATATKAAANALVDYEYDLPDEAKRRLIRQAAPTAGIGSPALLKLGLDEPSPMCRQMMFANGERASGPYLDSLIDAGDAGRAELRRFVDTYQAFDVSGLIGALGVTLAAEAGDAAARIATLQAQPKRNDAEDRALIDLLVLAGRVDDARTLAEASAFGSNAMDRAATALAIRSGDRRAVRERVDRVNQDAGLKIAARVLAGDAAAAADLLKDDIDNARGDDADRRQRLARLCLLTGRIEDAIGYYSGLGEVGVMRAHGRWAEALTQAPPQNVDGLARNRRELELERLRQEIGERPTQRPVRTPVALAPELRTAIDAAMKNDAAGVVAATDTLTPGDRASQTAALWLRAESLDTLGRAADATAARHAGDLHAVARPTATPEALARLDAAGLPAVADRAAERLALRQATNARTHALLGDRALRSAVRRQDWAAAVRVADDIVLWQALGGLSFSDPVANLTLHHTRRLAAGLLALQQGDAATAIEAAAAAVACLPLDITVPMQFCAKLRAAGEPAAADALFDRVWAAQTALVRQYPKAASLRNTAAWMALRCDRNVAEALRLATEATALQPDNDAFLDTLAEAQFRHGRKEQAVATMRRAQKLRPNDSVILARLKGFEQGKIVVPPEPE